jgi:type I restriction enzyme R subunit
MTSNFEFIQSPFSKLAPTLKQAEQQVYAASDFSAVLCRKSLEEWVLWLYENDGDLELPYDTTLNALMYHQDFKDLVPATVLRQINLVRKLGNDAVHTNLKVKSTEALHALQLMHGFTSWVVRVYSDDKPNIPVFDASLLPVEIDIVKTKEELKQLEEAFLQTQKLNRQYEEELTRLKANKKAHQQVVPPPVDPNEAITREIYINLTKRSRLEP